MRKHFKENKKFYIGLGMGVVFAGITCLIMRERYATLLSRVDGLETIDTSVTVRPLSIFSRQQNDIVTSVHQGTRGHPGFITRNLETGRYFLTQSEAARAFNINPSNLSLHLNGKYDHADGYHFERICVAA